MINYRKALVGSWTSEPITLHILNECDKDEWMSQDFHYIEGRLQDLLKQGSLSLFGSVEFDIAELIAENIDNTFFNVEDLDDLFMVYFETRNEKVLDKINIVEKHLEHIVKEAFK